MLHLAESCGHFWRPVLRQIDAGFGVEHIAVAHHRPFLRCGCESLRFFGNMSAGNSASKSSTRTIPPACCRNTISSPRRKTSTSELLTRNCFGSLTAWLFPDLNTRAMAMVCLPDIYTAMYIHLQAPIPELWPERRSRGDTMGSVKFGELFYERMAGTTRLELATSAVTVQQPEETSCNFTAP